MELAKGICEEFIVLGYWADYIDPCSGLPVRLSLRVVIEFFFLMKKCVHTDGNDEL